MPRARRFNLKEKMVAVLKINACVRMISREIATQILEHFPDDCAQKKERSSVLITEDDLIGQISAEIGSSWRSVVDNNIEIQFVETRPRQFYWDKNSKDGPVETIPLYMPGMEPNATPPKNKTFTEHDLYPLLGSAVFNELRCYSMRIDERAGSKKKGPRANHWLYPDIVGMIPLSDKWGREVSSLADSIATERVHLVSFEIKKDITRSDVREYFFQTVSNSAWANFAYLAAANLKGNAIEELSLLCSSYGIGFIKIDINDASNSQVIIPARLKANIDVNGLNRLAEENPDAREYVENVSTYIKTGRLKLSDWDLVPDNDE